MGRTAKRQKSLSVVTYGYFAIVGVCFVFCWLTGRDLAKTGNIRWTGAYTASILLRSLAFGNLCGVLLCAGIVVLQNSVRHRRRKHKSRRGESAAIWGKMGRHPWLFRTLLICLFWLPAFLAYYPAICAYDFPVQLTQIGTQTYVDHHPIAHTLLIWLFWQIGTLLGSVNLGIALLALLQMIFLAAVFARGICLLEQCGVASGWLMALQILSQCYLFHWYMSISMTKDTLFTCFFLLQMYAFALAVWEDRRSFSWQKADIGLAGATFGMLLFRNNATHAIVILLIVLLVAFFRAGQERQLWGRLLLVIAVAFVLGQLALAGLFHATHAVQGDRREMLSLPAQQLARCMLYHGQVGILPDDDGTMSEEDRRMIRAFLTEEGYQYYQADFADPVKRHVHTAAALSNAAQFIKTYLHLWIQYPGDYLNAFLQLNAGYLYPNDESHATVNQVDYAPGKGYAQTRWAIEEVSPYGFYPDGKWAWCKDRLEQWAEQNTYLRWPIVKYLFVPGTFLWAYLVLAGVWIMKKRTRMCMVFAIVFGYFLTLLLGPVVQLRYLYPLMVALPFLALLGGQVRKGGAVQ